METVATISKIDNGFIVAHDSGAFYLENFDVHDLKAFYNHEAHLRLLVLKFDEGGGKIPAIKAVREYCKDKGFTKYYGLKDAKDFVESIRTDEYWRGYPLPK